MLHVLLSSSLGFTSGVLGFLAYSSLVVASSLLVIIAFSFIPTIYSIKLCLNIFKKQEKNLIREELFYKLKLKILEKIKEKIEQDTAASIKTLVQTTLNLLTRKQILELKNEFEYIEEIYNTHTGIRRLRGILKDNYGKNNAAVNDILTDLKNIKKNITTADGLVREYFNEKLDHPISGPIQLLRPAPVAPDLNIPKVNLPFKKWLTGNYSVVTKTAFGTGLGTTAGNLVFPGILVALGTAKLSVIKFLGIGLLAMGLTTPLGAGLAILAVVFVGVLVTALAVYMSYRDSCRRQQLEHTKGTITAMQEKIDYRNNKLATLISVQNKLEKLDTTVKEQNLINKNHVPLKKSTKPNIHNAYSFPKHQTKLVSKFK